MAWLTQEARPSNKVLNGDQIAVLQASKAGNSTNSSAFFTRLATACRRFQGDAEKAHALPPAPSATLESIWRAMATTTEAYATSCLTLTHTGANADLTRWNDSLKSMDSANAALNAEVAKIRGASSGPTGGQS